MIGRGPGCDNRLKNQCISREHAVIKQEKGRFVLYDKSSNGTCISTLVQAFDTSRAIRTKVHVLATGDRITFGDDREQYIFKEISRNNEKTTDDEVESDSDILETDHRVEPVLFLTVISVSLVVGEA